jgi:pre-B-cell leukemia transcription factor 1
MIHIFQMDDPSRLMHIGSGQVPPIGLMQNPYNIGYMAGGLEHNAPTHTGEDGAAIGRKQDIGEILQQIMNITDQSLDEAQAR